VDGQPVNILVPAGAKRDGGDELLRTDGIVR
jgi:hypothetical protein